MPEYTEEEKKLMGKIIEISPDIDYSFDRSEFEKWKRLSRTFVLKGKFFLLSLTLDNIAESIASGQWEKEVVEKEKENIQDAIRKESYKLQMKEVANKIKITDVARSYGLDVKKQKSVCPFHGDTDPSLSFSDAKGVFYCFGCGEKGNILTFIKLMEELNDNNRKSKRNP